VFLLNWPFNEKSNFLPSCATQDPHKPHFTTPCGIACKGVWEIIRLPSVELHRSHEAKTTAVSHLTTKH
jgi:hypothetical protein